MNRSRNPFDPTLSRRIAAEFFSTPRKPGDPFWSLREVVSRFGITKYSATLAIASLEKGGILESSKRRGTFVARNPKLNLSLMEQVQMTPAFVWPSWGHDDGHGSLCEDVVNGLARVCRKNRRQLVFFDSAQTWNDPSFAVRMRASGANVLIAMDPPLEALVAMIELRQAGVPVLVLGFTTPVHERFGIPSINTEEREAACNLVLQLRHRKFTRFLVIGTTDAHSQQQRALGIEEAFERHDRTKPGDIFLEARDLDYRARILKERLQLKKRPEVLIFHNHLEFLHMMKAMPELEKFIRSGGHVAVFDDGYLNVHYPDLPLTRLVSNADELVLKSVELTTRLLKGLSVPPHTWIRRRILVPAGAGA